INLQRLFTADAQTKANAPEVPGKDKGAPSKPADAPGTGAPGPGNDIVIDFDEITIADGYVRYLDRATTPAFSSDLSAFTVNVHGASNQMGRQHTKMTARGTVGGSGILELDGELSGVGEGLRASLNGRLQDFPLPSVNPYAAQLTSWIVRRGRFTTKFQ